MKLAIMTFLAAMLSGCPEHTQRNLQITSTRSEPQVAQQRGRLRCPTPRAPRPAPHRRPRV